MCVLLESEDIPYESCDSDYEDNIPLSDYIEIMKDISEQSPISCRTRTQLKENPWVPAGSRRKYLIWKTMKKILMKVMGYLKLIVL